MVCLDWSKQIAQLGGFEAATLKAPGGHATGAFQSRRAQGSRFRIQGGDLHTRDCPMLGSRKRTPVFENP